MPFRIFRQATRLLPSRLSSLARYNKAHYYSSTFFRPPPRYPPPTVLTPFAYVSQSASPLPPCRNSETDLPSRDLLAFILFRPNLQFDVSVPHSGRRDYLGFRSLRCSSPIRDVRLEFIPNVPSVIALFSTYVMDGFNYTGFSPERLMCWALSRSRRSL